MNAGRYAVDPTVGASNGLSAVQDQGPGELIVAMRPLILVLKKLLKTHHLDDASTGGCGGYCRVVGGARTCARAASPGGRNPNLARSC